MFTLDEIWSHFLELFKRHSAVEICLSNHLSSVAISLWFANHLPLSQGRFVEKYKDSSYCCATTGEALRMTGTVHLNPPFSTHKSALIQQLDTFNMVRESLCFMPWVVGQSVNQQCMFTVENYLSWLRRCICPILRFYHHPQFLFSLALLRT